VTWRTLRIFLFAALLVGPALARGAERRVVAYVPTWVDLKSFADTVEYDKLTHVNVAFSNPVNDDGDLSFKEDVAVLVARARAHRVKVLVSIGGGGASGNKAMLARYALLLSDAKRPAFVAKLIDYVAAHDFDGLDVDLEGPSIGKDYGAFVADLAKALRPRHKLLTAALSKGYGGDKVPDSVFEHLDFVNVMAYDATGPWGPKSPGQHASMEFAKDNVRYWLGRGLPKSKAVLGVPFYGYGFGNAYRKRDYPYSLIVSIFPGAENADQAGDTVWYNGIPTIRAKARYVVDEGLGGVMIWSLDYDVKGSKSLLGAIHEGLAPPGATGQHGQLPGHPAKTGR
jgi:GH18 family chitinase